VLPRAPSLYGFGYDWFTIWVLRRPILRSGGALGAPAPPTENEYGDEPLATDLESSKGDASAGTRSGTDAPTRELPAAPATASEDRCGSCGTQLAHDQSYCVECGERRGQSRFPTAQPAPEVRSRRVRTKAATPRGPRVSAGTTLVAGVGVLLLAIGLGFLIGRESNKTTTAAASSPAVHVTVQGGGSGGASTGTTAASTPKKATSASTAPKGLSGKLKKAAAQTAPPPAAVQQKATQAASKVLGNTKNLAPPTVSTGQSCKSGAGCEGGKFTGNFFGN
jgi:hypothetical protein